MELSARFKRFWNRVRCNLYADRPAWAIAIVREYYGD
jgi:hypothetical protein